MHRHKRHLFRIIGKDFPVEKLTIDDLQQYIAKCSKERTKAGEKVTTNTINKAIVTFRTVWNWGARTKRLTGQFPSKKDLTFPKETEKDVGHLFRCEHPDEENKPVLSMLFNLQPYYCVHYYSGFVCINLFFVCVTLCRVLDYGVDLFNCLRVFSSIPGVDSD